MYALFGDIQNMCNFHNLEKKEKHKATRMVDDLIIYVYECLLSFKKMLAISVSLYITIKKIYR